MAALALGVVTTAAADESLSAPRGNAASEAAPLAKGKTAPRNVKYRVTPEGLVIETDGVVLRPKAEAVKIKGGWGVAVTLEVEAEERRVLVNPKNGPMAFAGSVKGKKGEPKKFGDGREGKDMIVLDAGEKKTFTRTFPSKGQAPIWWGQTLELEVGLWGLGDDKHHRPLRKLFSLKMVAGNKAVPVISPPNL